MGYYAGPKAPHLCSHVKFGLRGCTRLAGHVANGKDHFNMFDPYKETWKDEDGHYVEDHAQWCEMVNLLSEKGQNNG